MARFVLAGTRLGPTGAASRDLVDSTFSRLFARSASVFSEPLAAKRHRLLFDVEPGEVGSKAKELPLGVAVEPEIFHELAGTLDVFVLGDQGPLPGVPVSVILTSSTDQQNSTWTTDERGHARVDVPEGFQASFVISMPIHDFWWSWEHVALRPLLNIRCERLPDGPTGWWHDAVGAGTLDLDRGAGIRVGMIDSGVASHSCLSGIVRIGTFLDGRIHSDAASPPDRRHGTHVAGLIAARPVERAHFSGISPAVELFSASAFNASMTANQLDLANAIETLVGTYRVDLINMSLSALTPSAILRDAILDAQDEGTMCVCAAGNEGGAVRYPAAWPEAIAVGAIGYSNWGTPNSVARHHACVGPERMGEFGFYSPSFGCCDSSVVVGPGVGIISTVPSLDGHSRFGEMSGTSMATPVVTGTIAALLAKTRGYRETDAQGRVQMVSDLLEFCRSVGLPRNMEGKGVPFFS